MLLAEKLVGADTATLRFAADEVEGIGLQRDGVRARSHERDSTLGTAAGQRAQGATRVAK
jgi:hypothetical protein